MKIEILYPELCNLFGEIGTINYLKEIFKEHTIYLTSYNDMVKFPTRDIDLIYMGPMSESAQIRVIERLRPYKVVLEDMIEKNKAFFIIGNANEIFGKYIEHKDSKIEGLGILDFYSETNLELRHNSTCFYDYESLKVVGVKSQFSQVYYQTDYTFMDVIKGSGLNSEVKRAGINKNNYFGTYLLGPMLILNPDFLKKIFEKMKITDYKLPFEELLYEAYNKRIEYHSKAK